MSRVSLRDPARTALSALTGSVLCAGALLAQGNPSLPVTLTEPVTPVTEHITPDGISHGLYAGGRNYKVSFHDGMVYYPHVGPSLPHQPVRWRTTSVRAGGRELLSRRKEPAPVWQDRRCEYHLGPVTERYDVLVDGVEQSFVFATSPGAGDIVITGEITSPLQLVEAAESQQPLTFALADGRPVVRYGQAVAIDAAGRKSPVLTAARGSTITLRLPESLAADAAYPLVIDPLLSNTLLEAGAPIVDCDVLHETLSPPGFQARTWVVYSREVAAGDGDLWVQRFNTDFTGVAIPTFDEISPTWNARHGRIALAPGSSRVVIAYATGPFQGGGAASFIQFHRHDVNDLNRRTTVLGGLSAAGFNDFEPDLGGRHGTGNRMFVVFRRDSDSLGVVNTGSSAVLGAVIDPSVAGNNIVTVPPFPLLDQPTRDQEKPTINQSAGGPRWLVAFQEYGNTLSDDWDIRIAGVDRTGTVQSSGLTVEQAGNVHHKVSPELSGSQGRYLLTYVVRQFDPLNTNPTVFYGENLYAQRIDWDHGAGTGSRPHPSVLLQSDPVPALVPGGSAFDFLSESHWCATVHDRRADTYTVYKLGYRGAVVESGTIGPVPGPVTVEPVPGGVAFNDAQRDFQFVFGLNNSTAGNNRLMGSEMAYQPVQPPATYGTACGPGSFGGVAAMANRQQIGSEGLTFRLVNAPLDTGALLALSLGVANQSLDGLGFTNCSLLVDPRAGSYLGTLFFPISGGRAEFALDLTESLGPASVFAQWFYIVPPAPGGLRATEGLNVQIRR